LGCLPTGCLPTDDLAEYSKDPPPAAPPVTDAGDDELLPLVPAEGDASLVDAADAAAAALDGGAQSEAGPGTTGNDTTPASGIDPAPEAGAADATAPP
jgi:hypothetical protein